MTPGSSKFVSETAVIDPFSVIGLFFAVNPGECQILSCRLLDLAGDDLVIARH